MTMTRPRSPGSPVESVYTPLSLLRVVLKLAAKSPLLPGATLAFHYNGTGGTPSITSGSLLAQLVASSLSTVPPTAANAPAKFLSPALSGATNACVWETYDVSAAPSGGAHGSPIVVGTFTNSGLPVGTGQAEGVAAVIRIQSNYGSDSEFVGHTRPRARDRGRIYFGPLASSLVVTSDTNGKVALIPACAHDLCAWIHSISVLVLTDSTQWTLSVWSRRDALFKPLTKVEMDDRFDYQRRRAGKPAVNVILPIP